MNLTLKKSKRIEETKHRIDPNVLDSHQQRKYRRIRAIERILEERGSEDYNRFLAELQYYGIRKKVAEEYIEILEDLGKITIEKGCIIYKAKSKK